MRTTQTTLEVGEFQATCLCREFTTTDKAAWAEHHKANPKHGADVKKNSDGFSEAFRKSITKPWKAPSLKDEGRPFDPALPHVGAVMFKGELIGTTPWSRGGPAHSMWVTPNEPIEGVRFLLVQTSPRRSPEVIRTLAPEILRKDLVAA